MLNLRSNSTAMFTINDRVKRNVLVTCDHGLMIVNRFDDTHSSVGHFLLHHGNNNTVEAQVTVNALHNRVNPVILDVGANIGTYATWLAPFFPKGKIYCFEPQRIVFQMLCGNMAINNIDNVYAYNLLVGKRPVGFHFLKDIDYEKSKSFGAFSFTNEDLSYFKSSEIRDIVLETTLDNFIEDYHLDRVDFIKIDAEGMDIDVLEGAKKVIKTFQPTLLVEYLLLGDTHKEDSAMQGKEILTAKLKEFGYKATDVNGWNLLAIPE